MSFTNETNQVLIPKGNVAILTADQNIEDLAIDQLGIFDANTNLSITGANPVKDFFIAVGKDTNGGGVVNDAHLSAGQSIQARNIEAFTFKPHTAGRPQIVEVTGIKAVCDTDYAIKVQFNNLEILSSQGSVPFMKTYVAKSTCCEDCTPCAAGQSVKLVQSLVKSINIDTFDLIGAESIAVSTVTIATHSTVANYSSGDVISEADVNALIVWNEAQTDESLKVFIGLRLTTLPTKIKNYSGVDLNYFKGRSTSIVVSLVDGFTCSGLVTTTQNSAYEQGNATDIQQKEYIAGGWNNRPGPYRVSSVTGLASSDIEYFAEKGKTYDQYNILYTFKAQATSVEIATSNISTTVAISDKDTVTRNSFAVAIDGILNPFGFDALADDVAVANTDETVVEESGDTDNTDEDGVA